MTKKTRWILQLGLLGALMQITLALLVNPSSAHLAFQTLSLLLVFLLIVLVLCYFYYFSRELSDFKMELQTPSYQKVFSISYFMLVLINAVGVYFLMTAVSLDLSVQQESILVVFSHTSLFLLGFDLMILTPRKSTIMIKGREGLLKLLILLFILLLRNPVGILCFLLYTGLGLGFSKLFQTTKKGLELSFFSHIVRDSLFLICLMIFW